MVLIDLDEEAHMHIRELGKNTAKAKAIRKVKTQDGTCNHCY
jgi:hypothetical protein